MATKPLIMFFKAIKCNNSFFPNYNSSGLVSIKEDSTLPEVFEKLITNRILSVPVVNNEDKVVSLFSMLDLVCYFVNEFSEEQLKGLNSKKTSEFFFHYSTLKERKSELLSERTLNVCKKEIKDFQNLDPLFTIEDGVDVFEAIKILVKSGAHRVVVHNKKDGKLTGLITQSRILEFIGTSILDTVDEASQSIAELNLGLKRVISIDEKDMAINAFKLMNEKKISAVAVVDESGVLIGNISANDLKLVGYNLEYFSYLSRPTREYLLWVNDQSSKTSIRSQILLQEKQSDRDLLAITCNVDNTLAFVIKSLNLYHVHRLYIIDKDRRPIGVISIHDILEKLFK